MFVYTAGHGVHGFTLDPSIGEFLLSHENISTPVQRQDLLGERGLRAQLEPGGARGRAPAQVRARRQRLRQDAPTGAGMSARYIGSLVADFHRNLLYGGVFLYPADHGQARRQAAPDVRGRAPGPDRGERRRLRQRRQRSILDIKPDDLHMRVPLYIGSRDDVLWIEKMLSEGDLNEAA